MKAKTRPIKDLYFRFIEGTHFEEILNAQQAAGALMSAGLIELVPHTSQPCFEHYKDLVNFRTFGKTDNGSYTKIMDVFYQYAIDQGLL